MDTFETATAVARSTGDSFSWDVPDGWQQGRGAWGGLVVGALLRAVTLSEPDPGRTVRSVAAQLAAPAMVGRHSVSVRQLRRGSAMTTWAAEAVDARGRLVATAVAVLGSPRMLEAQVPFAGWGTAMPPTVPSMDVLARLPMGPPLGPVFGPHLEFHPASGLPVSGGRAETTGWIRFARPVRHSGESLVALVDGWWPAALVALDEARPMATVSFSANLLVDPASIAPDAPLLHHGFVSAAAEGFASEQRRLWTADGRLVVDNLQSIAVIA